VAEAAKLGVLVPAYNEEGGVEPVVRSIVTVLTELQVSHEVILVNDGSGDATGEIIDGLAGEFDAIRAYHQENQGLGGALRTAIGHATAEYVMLWPADMPVERQDYEPFISRLGRADVLVGCRIARLGYNPLMRFNALLYPFLVRMLFGLKLRDVNWIHLYRGDLVREIEITQPGIPMLTEVLVRLRDNGATFCEFDVHMKPREDGVASASRMSVMWKTLTGLFRFWRLWRKEKK
jgi:glycosyltransferase involved in cell wall biosynthesis